MRYMFVMAAAGIVLAAQPSMKMEKMSGPRSMEDLFSLFSRNWAGTLVVLSGDAGYVESLQARLREEPLLGLAIPMLSLDPKRDAGLALCSRQGWDEQPRWALFDSKGEAKTEGSAIPDAEKFAGQLLAAGLQDADRVLETLIRKAPGHVEARGLLLSHRLRVAAVRSSGSSAVPRAGADLDEGKRLEDAEDRRIWGTCSEALDGLLKQEGWALSLARPRDGRGWITVFPESARFSDAMQQVCRRHLSKVQDALLKSPGDEGLWRAWLHLASVVGARDLRKVTAEVVRDPFHEGDPLPPRGIMKAYVDECRKAKDWRTLKDVMAPRFKELQEWSNQDIFKGSNFRLPGVQLASLGWEETAAPYLEALLHLGETSEAEARVQEMLRWKGAGSLPKLASGLARACGQADLAERWAGLSPVEGGR